MIPKSLIQSGSNLRPQSRSVSLQQYRLIITDQRNKKHELRSVNIPQPQVDLGFGHVKMYSVLGQQTLLDSGKTHVVSGDSISGMAFYIYENYVQDNHLPKLENGIVQAKIIITDVFGKKRGTRIQFKEQTFEQLESILPGFDMITYQYT